jgi:CheY-like chemotaxis protein
MIPLRSRDASDKSLLVLLVDDDPDTQEMLAAYFRLVGGLRLVEDVTPESAFERALATIPDVVVTEYRISMFNGFELCQQLRAHPTTMHIPIIMVTASPNGVDFQQFRTICGDVFLKPYAPDKLVAAIRRFTVDAA